MDSSGPGGPLSLRIPNDYLSPSQICIRPLPGGKPKPRPNAGEKAETGEKIEVGEKTGVYYDINRVKDPAENQAVSINLDDCLACSGCVTSTETVMIASQTHRQVVDILAKIRQICAEDGACSPEDTPFRVAFATLSPQTVASFSAKYLIEPLECYRRIRWFLKSMGVSAVFDSSFGRDFSLLECAKEFVRRFRRENGEPGAGKILPLFTSSCPGWICYAEKVHSHIIPFITTVKSPQQVLGSFVKDFVPSICLIPKRSIYHFSIMPCYDKKLESSRADFKVDDLAEVDCVITSVELESMMKENNFNFADFCAQGPADENANPAESFDPFSACSPPRPSPPSGTGASSSGGYQSFVMRYAAKELFDIELTPEAIEEGSAQVKVREISSPDCKEYTLEDSSSGRCLLRFYRVYGFKGMQSVLRAVKKQESAGRLPSVNRMPISRGASGRSRISAFSHDFHFVEIMACPSGCINGAGQLKSEVKSEPLHSSSQALLTKNAEIAYQLIERSRSCLLPERGDALRNLYNRWLHASSDEKSRIREVLHTQYRAVQKSDFLGLKW